MKNKLLLLGTLIVLTSACQVSNVPVARIAPNYAEFAQATNTKDTLYLVTDDPMAKIIKKIWDEDTVYRGEKPEIIFVPQDEMVCIKERCNEQSKKRKR
jgi:hypothetical protein